MPMRLLVFTVLCLHLATSWSDDNDEDEEDVRDHEYYERLQREAPMNIIEQDIIPHYVNFDEMASSALKSAALKKAESKWPDGRVPYEFSPNFTKSEKRKIKNAMNEFKRRTCIHFDLKDPEDHSFIIFLKSYNPRKCSSHVGRTGSMQRLFLGSNCFEHKTLLHEMMHALGFIHEHNRPDRGRFVTIKKDNIQKGFEGDFEKWSEANVTLLDTDYAYESIMHYHWNAFAKNSNNPTIVPTGNFHMGNMGGGNTLSEIDVTRINYHYCGGETTSVVTSPTLYDHRGYRHQITQPPPPTPPHDPPTMTPGFEWHVDYNGINWSPHCDLPSNEFKIISSGSHHNCATECERERDCDHFSWSSDNDGTCWLKKGYVVNKAKAQYRNGHYCGYVKNKA